MKKKLLLALTSGLLVSLSLAGCNEVSENKDAIVTIKNHQGETVDILTDSIYNKFKDTNDGISKFYDAVLGSLIRYEYQDANSALHSVAWPKAIKTLNEIKVEAANNVKNDKNTADENAKTNGTTYETEWNNILKARSCENEEELLQYYIYNLEKEDVTDKFFLFNQDSTLTSEYLGIDDEGEEANPSVKGVFPYHIRHILVSKGSGTNQFYQDTITESEAKALSNTMNALLDDSYTFAEVAEKYSGDSGSAAKGGDVGIMATTTSFVNEFKLGIYAYDAIYTNNANGNEVIKAGLGLDKDYNFVLKDNLGGEAVNTTAENYFGQLLNGGTIQTVPYGAFTAIGDVATTTADSNGKQVAEGNEHYYPRNILWNYYLNYHNPFVITYRTVDQTNGFPSDPIDGESKYFVEVEELGLPDGDRVLTDGEGHVIIGVRSEHGIHLMIMEKSIHEYQEGGQGVDEVSLEEYYTSYVPGDTDYPTDSHGKDKQTYVNFIQTTESKDYTERANEVKNAVKSFDGTYDYRLFTYLLGIEGENISIKDETLEEKISEYILETQSKNKSDALNTLNTTWRTYCELIALQYSNRTTWTANDVLAPEGEAIRTIHPRCAVGFKTHTGTEWNEGGACYYAK